MANSTDEERQISFVEMVCEAFIQGINESAYGYSTYVALAVLNGVFSFFTTIGNILVIFALKKESSLHPPTNRLFYSLACTDLGTGLLIQPMFVLHFVAIARKNLGLCVGITDALYLTSTPLGTVSLLTLAFISIDRYLALSMGLRYRQVVTLKKVRIPVFFSWFSVVAVTVVSFLWGLSLLFVSFLYITTTGACIAISGFCYIKMFLALRQHQNQIQDQMTIQHQQVNGNVSENVRQLSKTMSAVIWVLVWLIVFSVPNKVVIATLGVNTPSSLIPTGVASTLFNLSSTFNPVIYCWRMRSVRQAMIETIRQLLCKSQQRT